MFLKLIRPQSQESVGALQAYFFKVNAGGLFYQAKIRNSWSEKVHRYSDCLVHTIVKETSRDSLAASNNALAKSNTLLFLNRQPTI